MPDQTSAAFISYSREDSEFALRLAQDLKAAGARVWLDQLELKPGLPWDNAIEDALLDAQQMMVILSPTSVKSENVRDEISYALRQGKVVIPVLYMECTIPLRLERKQHIDCRTDYAGGLAKLLAELRVESPNQAILDQAATADAQRQAAWQAREEAQRLREANFQDPPPYPLQNPTVLIQSHSLQNEKRLQEAGWADALSNPTRKPQESLAYIAGRFTPMLLVILLSNLLCFVGSRLLMAMGDHLLEHEMPKAVFIGVLLGCFVLYFLIIGFVLRRFSRRLGLKLLPLLTCPSLLLGSQPLVGVLGIIVVLAVVYLRPAK